ncbi:hypothetical protein E2C01_002659 [Portunus trituberculatus]|uniref:Uncharacterized protein n=1 Tax=Portunus trituberculatus TaxID=210409 RepID=A0A5B7CMR6_PORTR|nr:hypothetical protein [Portunus trituberculatus]
MGLQGRPFGPSRLATKCQVATGGSCSLPEYLGWRVREQRAVWSVQGKSFLLIIITIIFTIFIIIIVAAR